MKNKVPEFIENATNVYRTKKYIVKQIIGIQYGCEENNVVYSRDTYYNPVFPPQEHRRQAAPLHYVRQRV